MLGSIPGANTGFEDRTNFGLFFGVIDVSSPVQEVLICDGIEPMEVIGELIDAVTILEVWTMEGYAVGLLKGVSVDGDRI